MDDCSRFPKSSGACPLDTEGSRIPIDLFSHYPAMRRSLIHPGKSPDIQTCNFELRKVAPYIFRVCFLEGRKSRANTRRRPGYRSAEKGETCSPGKAPCSLRSP